jgi:hypothetical protein
MIPAAIPVIAAVAVAGCSSSSNNAAPATAVTSAPSVSVNPSSPPPSELTGAVAPGDVIDTLRAAGLPVAETKEYTPTDDPNQLLGRPNQYTGKVSFHDSTLPFSNSFGTDGGGSVEVFASADDARARSDYIASVIGNSPLLAEYDYLHGAVLLRLGHELTPDQAKAYQDALNRV